jgi:outer membrane lipoprotein-sorting protein
MKLNTGIVRLFLMLTLVCFSTSIFSTLKDTIFNQAKDTKSINSLFIQERRISVLPLPLVSTGKFKFHYQEGMLWETLKPVQSRIIISEKGIQEENNFVRTEIGGSSQLGKVLLSLFSGDLASLESYFFIVTKGDVNKWNLFLEPKNSLVSSQITSISIEGRESVESIYLVEANGDSSRLKFNHSRINFISKGPSK